MDNLSSTHDRRACSGDPWKGRVSDGVIDIVATIAARETVSVLHTPQTGLAATDIESRFVEAALGSLHSADLRSFGHGRHLWLAKRADRTGVLALISEDYKGLADRTLALLPAATGVFRVDFRGAAPLQALSALLVGLHFAGAGGRYAGIDPGNPRVPSFGRKLYNLGPGRARSRQSELNRDAAIARKEISSGNLSVNWRQAWSEAFQRFRTTPIRGIVLDYDGTISDFAKRFDPVPDLMRSALVRAQSLGLIVGVATGRGPSAGRALRKVFPENTWTEIVIGYYNGSVVTTLDDQRDPIVDGEGDAGLISALSAASAFHGLEIHGNDRQISIRLAISQSALEMVEIVKRIAAKMKNRSKVLAS